MNYIMLFIAAASTPAYMGTYSSEQECKNAIRLVYQTRLVPPRMNLPQTDLAIDTKMKYQQEFVCAPSRKQPN